MAIGIPRNNISSNSDASDAAIDEAAEVEVEEVSSDSTATTIEPNKVDLDEPPSTVTLEVVNVLPSSSSDDNNIISSSNDIYHHGQL